MIREIVLDDKTGLPEVRVSRSEDGQLTFRVHRIHPGGMSVYEPINDALLRSIRERYKTDGEDVDWATRIEDVAKAFAASLRNEDEDRKERVEALEAQVSALGELAEQERQRADQAEARLAELEATVAEDESSTAPVRQRAARGRQRAAA